MSEGNAEGAQIDYTRVRDRRGPFAQYLIEELPELLQTAHDLRELHRLLAERCNGQSFQRLQEDHDYRPVLLGGITDEGEYAENSYAKLFERLFGLQWADPSTAIASARAGLTIDVNVVVEETALTALLDEILRQGSTIVESMPDRMGGWEPTAERLPDRDDWAVTVDDSELNAIIDDPEVLVDRLQQFLGAVQSILPNHDERALFIWTLDYSPRFYLEVAYPALETADEEDTGGGENILDEYEQFLGLAPVFQPELGPEDESVRRDFTVYAFREESIGRRLLTIYSAIWDAFEAGESDDERATLREGLEVAFPSLPDPKQSFREEAGDALEALDDYTRPEELDYLRVVDTTEAELDAHKEERKRRQNDNLVTFPSVSATLEAEYEISGGVLTACAYRGWWQSTSGNLTHYNEQEEVNIPLPNVLRDLAPPLFLLHGIDYQLDIDEGHLELTKL